MTVLSSPSSSAHTDITTVSVWLTPRHDGIRAFDTTMFAVRGEIEFTDEELKVLRETWPMQEEVT